MNANIVYLIVVLILTWIYFQTRSLKSNENEYFVLNKSEGVLGLSLSFYASGMGLWILTSPAEVAWYGFCLLYTSPSPRDDELSRMPSSA